MPTAKTATHHEFPVITIKQIGKQYNVSGMDVRQAKAKLEALGIIEPIRKGSHTYKILNTVPDTLAMLEEDYINTKYTYTLPDDYPAILQSLADLIDEVKKLDGVKQGSRNIEPYIKEKFITAQERLQQAYDELRQEDILSTLEELPRQCKFVNLPIHDSLKPISRQRRLENIISLLDSLYYNLYGLETYFTGRYIVMLQHIAVAIDLLKEVTIPSTIQERNKAKCAES